jgi:hypothetical protein
MFGVANGKHFFCAHVNDLALVKTMNLFCNSKNKRKIFRMPFHVTVVDAVSDDAYGTVSCIPGPVFRLPISVDWQLDGQSVLNDDIGVDASGCCARRVPPHKNVTINVVDKDGVVETVSTRVGVQDLPVVMGYIVKHSTTASSMDGSVSAEILRAPARCKYLWTSGVITDTPSLVDCRCGVYAITLLAEDLSKVSFLHACPVAQIDVCP